MQLWIIGVLAVLLVIFLERRSRVRARRVREPAVLRLDSATLSEVQDLVRRGKKIEAIKLYRERSGADLRTAKEAVEHLERQPLG